MGDKKFVCYWNRDIVEIIGIDFFSVDRGYFPESIDLIHDLRIGDVADLSDGIAQTHYVLRVN